MKILQTVTLISLLTVGVASPLLSMEMVEVPDPGHKLSASPERAITKTQDQQTEKETPKSQDYQPSWIKGKINSVVGTACYVLKGSLAIDSCCYVFNTLRYYLSGAPVTQPIQPVTKSVQPKQVNSDVFSQADEATSLKDLVSSRLNKDLIRCSKSYIFSGINGVLQDASGQRCIQSQARIASLFSSRDDEIMSLTSYEMLEIFLDTVFGLQPGVEGVPLPEQCTGSLGILLKSKLDFTIGTARDGKGQPYGNSKTTNHFSDGEKSTGHFECGKRIDRASPPQAPRPLSPAEGAQAFRIAGGGNIVKFFEDHKSVTDYQRLVSLFNIFTTTTPQV